MSDSDTSPTISFTYKPHPQYHSHTSPTHNIIHIQDPPTISFTHKTHPHYHSHTSPTISFTYKPHNIIPSCSSSVWFLTNLISCTTQPLQVVGLCNYSDTKSHYINVWSENVKLLVVEEPVNREHPLSHTYIETTERWLGWHSHLPLSTSCVFHSIPKHPPLLLHSCEHNGKKTEGWRSSS
jgi:hypothetical protein